MYTTMSVSASTNIFKQTPAHSCMRNQIHGALTLAKRVECQSADSEAERADTEASLLPDLSNLTLTCRIRTGNPSTASIVLEAVAWQELAACYASLLHNVPHVCACLLCRSLKRQGCHRISCSWLHSAGHCLWMMAGGASWCIHSCSSLLMPQLRSRSTGGMWHLTGCHPGETAAAAAKSAGGAYLVC